MGTIIGIDLGTTNSCVAIMENGKSTIIANKDGSRTTPSVVSYKDNIKLVGGDAKRQAIINPDTISSIKRKMGSSEHVKLNDVSYSPEEVSGMILQFLKGAAEDYLGTTVSDAVITVPAYFNDAQRQATKNAGRIAGLNVKRIINEPTAAALAYGIDKRGKELKILVFDLGGGTFDVSILEISDGTFDVLSTAGDNNLGGDDFDNRIVEYILTEIKKVHNLDFAKDNTKIQQIKEEAEKVKKTLSSAEMAVFSLPYITMINNVPIHFETKITRAKFEQLIADLAEKVVEPLKLALEDAKLTSSDIDEVLLVGGSTRVPLIQEKVRAIINKEPSKSINPDEVVAEGAAIQGGVLGGLVKDILLLDVTPLTLGIETMGDISTPLINRNTTIPVEKSQVFTTSEENQPAVDIHVVQGEFNQASQNKSLGRFTLTDIQKASRGVPKIEVTFSIDANGILNVRALDQVTNRDQSIVISDSTNLSEEVINEAIAKAERNKESDDLFKKKAAISNKVESAISEANNIIGKCPNAPTAEKEALNVLLSNLQNAIQNKSFDGYEQKLTDLRSALNKLQDSEKTAAAASPSDSADSGVVTSKDDTSTTQEEVTEVEENDPNADSNPTVSDDDNDNPVVDEAEPTIE